ncbi:MAG: hypothetical protein J6Y67_01750 [Lachnospiraceae bacterium]|nr:hypothetical protein [Lachnospiraceae bacterium]
MRYYDKYLSGLLESGEYDSLRCIGRTYFKGRIQCRVFSSAGTLEALDPLDPELPVLLRAHRLYICGQCHVPRVIADDALFYENSSIRGELHVAHSLVIREKFTGRGLMRAESITMTGPVKHHGAVTCITLTARGYITLGDISCNGLRIEYENQSSCRSIRAVNVLIHPMERSLPGRIFLKSWDREYSEFRARGDIRGSFIELERVSAATVIGDEVIIGPGCAIEKVLYRSHLYIDDTAWVGWYEPIGDSPDNPGGPGTPGTPNGDTAVKAPAVPGRPGAYASPDDYNGPAIPVDSGHAYLADSGFAPTYRPQADGEDQALCGFDTEGADTE